MGKFFASTIGKVVVALIILGLLFAGYSLVKRFFTAGLETQVKLEREKGKAGVASGSDAVDTVGNQMGEEANLLAGAQETKNEINRQTDAGGVTSAGRRGLCDRSPNRRGCGGVQRTPAR